MITVKKQVRLFTEKITIVFVSSLESCYAHSLQVIILRVSCGCCGGFVHCDEFQCSECRSEGSQLDQVVEISRRIICIAEMEG